MTLDWKITAVDGNCPTQPAVTDSNRGAAIVPVPLRSFRGEVSCLCCSKFLCFKDSYVCFSGDLCFSLLEEGFVDILGIVFFCIGMTFMVKSYNSLAKINYIQLYQNFSLMASDSANQGSNPCLPAMKAQGVTVKFTVAPFFVSCPFWPLCAESNLLYTVACGTIP